MVEAGLPLSKAQRQFAEHDQELLLDPPDPDGRANPGKVMPTPRLCGEVPGPYRRHPLEEAGLAERM